MEIRLTSCTVDLDGRTVDRGGQTTPLTPREVDVLRVLAEQPNQIVPKAELVGAVWGHTSDKTLSVALRRLRTKLESDPSNPEHLQMHRGVGVRLVVPDRPVVPGLLAPPTPMVGRDEERDLVAALLREGSRLVLLLGPGGVGKTRLATEVAMDWAASGAVRFFDLSSAKDEADVIRAVASGLGASVPPTEVAIRAILSSRSEAPQLWVLDNVEQVAEPVAACLRRWLVRSAALRVLATSRTALQVAGERRVRLDPLDQAASVQLLRHAAPDLVGPKGEVSEAVLELIGRVDGLPLALQLAAPIASVVGPDVLLQRWDAMAPSLDAAFRWSWDLLSPEERHAAVVLATLQAPFDFAMAEALLGPESASAMLQRLVGCSLVQVGAGADHRFRMLTLLRQAVLDQCSDEQRLLARDRHSAAVRRTLAGLVQRSQDGDLEAPQRVEHWLVDVEAALRHACATSDADAAFALVNPLLTMVARRGRRVLYGTLLERALSLDGGDEVARGEALYRLASVYLTKATVVQPAAEQALRIARRHGLRDLEGRALARLAECRNQQDPGSGMETFRTAVQIYDDDPSLSGWLPARFGYGVALLQRGAFQDVDAVLRAVPADAKPYDRLAMQTLAVARLELSAHADAAESAGLELVAACERVGDVDGVGRQLNNVGSTLMTRGLLDRAQPYLERALARRRALGLEAETAIAATNLASVHLQRGDLLATDAQLAEAEEILGDDPDDRVVVMLRIVRVLLQVRADRRQEASDAIDRMQRMQTVWGNPRYRGILLVQRAMLLAVQGDSQAESVVREGVRSLRREADLLQRLMAQLVLARIHLGTDRLDAALGQAQRTYDAARRLGHLRAEGRAAALAHACCLRRGDADAARAWRDRASRDAEDPTIGWLLDPTREGGDLRVSETSRTLSLEARWAARR
ncbi:MAG: winged helix-turn-helix domain-containing protein [Myxococcales bacterium]|nr:winged helix-turn-helix domain-containing protein [Myxococcales bacterium]